ncbi:sugar O-acyltransferase, sialic acid O-acetyltransferase NeuD family [Marivirga sericea]|uniref:Sugar O-acyltransferase, sialic acid O-acetyltransferase NeuD family n=1 Tax=Marivirga sericea TaxID=1028 RepID=A0A1X7IAH2_9BACT|nr:acetyltransferase [Marivirga sericea]SMG11026.1 sugar O-acyltransferase, sialic acid O-acetyltransferase NeuD family [Marivirga sericea]
MLLFGASGHAKVIIDILLSKGVQVKGFYDEDEAKRELWGIPVMGKTKDFKDSIEECIVSIGENATRKKVVSDLGDAEFGFAIHKKSNIGSHVEIGEGTVVMAGTVINADAKIGNHVIINTCASVDHDCKVGDFAHIAPNASLCGGVEIGEGTLIGAGSTVIPLIKIGKWCTIGAGAVVVEDIPDNSIVVGNPARVIKTI